MMLDEPLVPGDIWKGLKTRAVEWTLDYLQV
jgi:hypothetical protein